jgi:peptidoglycan/LPS O-acetylase OafA/YrhL
MIRLGCGQMLHVLTINGERVVFSLNGQTVGDLLTKHKGQVPGFNAMRFLAASAVLVAHSFGVAQNRQSDEPLLYYTKVIELGHLGVFVFFFISGFVITQSCMRSSPLSFLIKRTARIMPGLVLVTIFCALLLGPLMTSYPLRDYFTDRKFFEFFLNDVFILRGQLPGVFQNNPSGDHVNISLWTLRYEVLCYVVILAVVATGRFVPQLVAVMAIGLSCLANPAIADVVALRLGQLQSTVGIDLAYLFKEGMLIVPFFFVGSLFYFLRARIVVSVASLMMSLLVIVVTVYYQNIFPLFPFALGYAVITLGLLDGRFCQLFKDNDYSYGIYIFAFPVQQVLATLSQSGMTWWQSILLSFPIVLALAAVSWHLIERPSLRYARGLDKRWSAPDPAQIVARWPRAAPAPDWPIRELFRHIAHGAVSFEAHARVGRDVLDKLATGQIIAWGRAVDHDAERPLARIDSGYWREASFTFLNGDRDRVVDVVGGNIRHCVCYRDIQVNKADALRVWMKDAIIVNEPSTSSHGHRQARAARRER